MAKLSTKEIRETASKFLEEAHEGVRWVDLLRKIHGTAPETPMNTIASTVQQFLATSHDVAHPSRGLWILKKHLDEAQSPSVADEVVEVQVESKGQSVKLLEDQFYQPFADWLRDDAGEVIESLALGGKSFKSKWGTPDVIGVYKPKKSDFVQFEIEIVSAEIKIDPIQSVVAFGQASAYRLFSHKSYIVMPRTILPDDQDRLDALCAIYGVGLVLFDLNPETPNFQFVVKAQRLQPDTFYVNEFARRLHEISRADFDRLF